MGLDDDFQKAADAVKQLPAMSNEDVSSGLYCRLSLYQQLHDS